MPEGRRQVLVVVDRYPETTETYVKTEIETLAREWDVAVVTRKAARHPFSNHLPFRQSDDLHALRELVQELRPAVIHTHYLWNAPLLADLAAAGDALFTVRAHSCDTMAGCNGGCPSHFAASVAAVNSERCRGVLTFPYTRPALEQAGVSPAKIVDCFPVIDFARFHDESDNGDGVLHVGSCQPKKGMANFLALAGRMPDQRFNLYAVGAGVDLLRRINVVHGDRARIENPVEPDAMPAVYKRHRWLAYTACTKLRSVGWPVAVAEAQAAGVGVCLPNFRPDLRDYVGEGGVLYESMSELQAILSRPVPDAMRQAGFAQARKSDVDQHIGLLTELWN